MPVISFSFGKILIHLHIASSSILQPYQAVNYIPHHHRTKDFSFYIFRHSNFSFYFFDSFFCRFSSHSTNHGQKAHFCDNDALGTAFHYSIG